MKSVQTPLRLLISLVLIVAALSARASLIGTWSAAMPMPAARYAHAAATLGTSVHVVGGVFSNVTCSFETSHVAYDPAANQWLTKAPLQIARVHAGAAVLNNGVKDLLYVIGGSTGCGSRTATVEAYDPDTNTWSMKAPMPQGPRSTMGVAVVDNVLYVIGGQRADSGPDAGMLATVETYDPITNTWGSAPSLPGVRYQMAAGAIDGRIYVAGGGNPTGYVNATLSFDPAIGVWTPEAAMPIAHSGAASVVADGRLYVIGGTTPPTGQPTGMVHVFDPSAGWSNGPSLPVVRAEIEGAAVNGNIVVMGGFDTLLRADTYVLRDDVAPVTTATASLPPNGNGWNNGDVTITFSATDDGSGVQSISYSLTGAQAGGATVAGNAAAVTVSAEGTTTIAYHAVDVGGNVESPRTLTVRIDKTAPLAGVPGNIVAPAQTTAGAAINFIINSSDSVSGVVSTSLQPLQSGATFPVGTTHQTVTVLDAAGNAAVAGFDVTIVPVRPQIAIAGGSFVEDGMPHPATVSATDQFGTPVNGTFTVAYAPGGTSPVAPGRYSASAGFISGDPAFTSVAPWSTMASDIERGFASSGAVNGRMYVVGVQPLGAGSLYRFRTSAFDPSTNTWTQVADAPFSRNQAGSAVIGTTMYVAGGCIDSDCGAVTNAFAGYNAATDMWTTLPPMPLPRHNLAAAAVGTRMYAAGGSLGFSATNTLQIYDLTTGSWSMGAPLPVAVWQAEGAALNGKFYVIGGLDASNTYRNIVQVFDPNTTSWSIAAPMTLPRVSFATAVANGRIYAIGGSQHNGVIAGSIESYDPAVNAWTAEASLPTPRSALVAEAIGGVLYASSGGSAAAASGTGITEALDLSLTTHITIEAAIVLQSITVSPASATLSPGQTQSFQATGHFSDGSSRVLMTAGPGPNVMWESSNPSVAGVNMFGLVTANSPGAITLRASAGPVICEGTGCATVTVIDTVPPTLGLPNAMTVEAFSAGGQAVTWFASAQDNVDGNLPVVCDPASGSLFPFGTTTVTCSATDASGNQGTGSFTVTVVDTNPPWLALPNSGTREANNAGGAMVTYFAAANDSVDGPIDPVCTPASGTLFGFGPTTVTCTATDAHGNTGTGSFTITVVDTTPPFLALPGSPQVREATNGGGANVTYTATANDTVDGPITPICNPVSGSQFGFGATEVTCSAMDSHGNTRTGAFTVIVSDTTAPYLGLPNSPMIRQATSAGGATVFYSASANDTADGPVLPTCSPASGSTFPLGSTTVTCTATDAHGNTRTGTFVIQVVDTNAPFLSLPGSPQVREATSSSGATVTFTVTANDSVDGNVAATCSPASGSTFALGSTPVACSATDASGNTRNGSFVVQVVDTTAPILTTPGPITAPAASPAGRAIAFTVTAVDSVSGDRPVACTPPSGSTFPIGTTTVACTAADAQGNSASASFTVTVLGTADIIEALMSEVEDFQQAARILENVLRSVDSGNTSAACAQLGAFISMVEGQSGKKLTEAEAQTLIRAASDARASLGCQA